jgi:hypothetical protein
MNMPINCPLCNYPLLNTFKENSDKLYTIMKVCEKRIDHTYTCFSDPNGNVAIIKLRIHCGTFYWDVRRQTTWIYSQNNTKTILPWFEPNFENRLKFYNKLKTYTVFS